MADCLFCKIIQGEIPSEKLYEDEHLIVIKDINPKAPVHLLVIPKVHVESLLTVEEDHANILAYTMLNLHKFAKEQGLSGFRTIINSGPGSGQEIFHIHVHILGGGKLPGF